MNRYLLPFGIFILLAVFLWVGLGLNPRSVPSPFIGKAAPEFQLPRLHNPQQTISTQDMQGKVWLLNVWASWCGSCQAEHKVITRLIKQAQIETIGLNYKDEPSDAASWLQAFGNPFQAVAVDYDGRTGFNWGVYGVPETFVIDTKGVIRYKFAGPVTDALVESELLPLIETLRKEQTG